MTEEKRYEKQYGEALEKFLGKINTTGFKKEYDVHPQKTLFIAVCGTNLPRVLLQINDGKITGRILLPGEVDKADDGMLIRSLGGFHRILMSDIDADQIFRFDGYMMEEDKLVREILLKGNFRDLMIFKDIIAEYLRCMRDVFYPDKN